MIDIKLDADDELKEFQLPESWSEITVKQYSKILKLEENDNDIERTVNICSILTGIDEDTLYMMSTEQFTSLSHHLSFLSQPVPEVTKESIEINGDTYYLKNDFNQLNVAETMSIEQILKDNGNDFLKAMPQMLCLLLRKKKDNGKLEAFKPNMMNRAELFGNNISIGDVNQLFLFFSIGKEE